MFGNNPFQIRNLATRREIDESFKKKYEFMVMRTRFYDLKIAYLPGGGATPDRVSIGARRIGDDSTGGKSGSPGKVTRLEGDRAGGGGRLSGLSYSAILNGDRWPGRSEAPRDFSVIKTP